MKNTYLKRMGIQTWHLRDAVHSSKYFQVMLRDASQKMIGIIIADLDDLIDCDAQKNLLQKIAEALTSQFSIAQANGVASELGDCHFVILLGENSKKNALRAKRVVESYSLTNLFSDVEHKKALWTEIKSLRQFFQ